MNRVVAVVITLLVVAGSVPAAATLADGTGAQETDPGAEPGAAFAGVVGVQQAEVDSEVAGRALSKQFAAAESNDSKARVVADQQGRLSEHLDDLEAEKARLERARENGSIGQGEYRARLAGLAAEIRAVERQANRTADVAASVPAQALRDNGANASAVREVAQRANRTGGGEVAEAARSVAGEGVGNGLGPPNASERGPPAGVGGPPDGVGPARNATDAPGNGTDAPGNATNASGPPLGAGPGDDVGPENASDTGPPNATNGPPNATNGTAGPPGDEESTLPNGSNVTVPGDTASNVTNESSVSPGPDGANGLGNATPAAEPGANETGSNETDTGVSGTDVPGVGDGGEIGDTEDSADGGDAANDSNDGPLDDGTETPTPTPDLAG